MVTVFLVLCCVVAPLLREACLSPETATWELQVVDGLRQRWPRWKVWSHRSDPGNVESMLKWKAFLGTAINSRCTVHPPNVHPNTHTHTYTSNHFCVVWTCMYRLHKGQLVFDGCNFLKRSLLPTSLESQQECDRGERRVTATSQLLQGAAGCLIATDGDASDVVQERSKIGTQHRFTSSPANGMIRK